MFVVSINPGDEVGFPSRPSKVHEVAAKDIAKTIADNPGAVILVMDTAALHKPGVITVDFGLPMAERLIRHAFMSIRRVLSTKTVLAAQSSRATGEREHEVRVWKEYMTLSPEERAKVRQPPTRPKGV